MSTKDVERQLSELAQHEAARREWLRVKAELEPKSLKWEAAFKAVLPDLMQLLDAAPERACKYAYNMHTSRRPAWTPEDVHPVDATRSKGAKAWKLSALLAPVAALAGAALSTAVSPWLTLPAAALFAWFAVRRSAYVRRCFVFQEEVRTGHLYDQLSYLQRALKLEDPRVITPVIVAMLAYRYRPETKAKAPKPAANPCTLLDEELETVETPSVAHLEYGLSTVSSSCDYTPAPEYNPYPYGPVNPASGLPMAAGTAIDVGGNVWGMNQ